MIVWGEGPTPCPIMLIGEAPGKHEIKAKRPFVPWAPAGAVLSDLLESIRLSRDQIYVTNLYKSRNSNDKAPTIRQIRHHEPLLLTELEEVNPTYVVTLGATATRYFLGSVTMEAVHGIPHPITCPAAGTERVVLPCIHPAAGLHDAESSASVAFDFRQLQALLMGRLAPRPMGDQYPDPEYLEITQPILVETLLAKWDVIAVDTEDTHEHWIQFSGIPGEAFMFRSSNTECLDRFKQGIAGKTVIFQNALHDLGVLEELNVQPDRFEDTMVKAFLLAIEPRGLKALAYRHAGMVMSDYAEIVKPRQQRLSKWYFLRIMKEGEWDKPPKVKEYRKDGTVHYRQPQPIHKLAARALNDMASGKDVDLADRWKKWDNEVKQPVIEKLGPFPFANLDHVRPRKKAVGYACADADGTLRVNGPLDERIDAMGLRPLLEIDQAVLPMVHRMMQVGMKVDGDYLESLRDDFQREMDSIRKQMKAISDGMITNPGSNDQVRDFLFTSEGENFPIRKRTPTGQAQVTKEVMESLKGESPVARLRLDYKELEKLKGTYADGIRKWIDDDGRVRATIKTTTVVSGRFSSVDPNVLAIPVRSELGKKIRHGFVAPEGRVLGSYDYSQLELRLTADESQDERMLEAFREGEDIHDVTEQLIFGTSGPNRIPAKTCNFSIIYDTTDVGLQWSLIRNGIEWSLQQCRDLIEEWLHNAYPGVLRYMESKRAEARRYGYVRDRWGRIRYLPHCRSRNDRIRADANRKAGNFPIQAGAAGIIKKAMAKVWNDVLPYYWRDGSYIECILQIHDELLFEMDEDIAEEASLVIPSAMSSVVRLSVPLIADGVTGRTWGELK